MCYQSCKRKTPCTLGLNTTPLQNEVNKWLEKNKLMWKQMSKVLWLRERDRNSKYFHMKASMRRHKNRFCWLQNYLGEWVEGHRIEELVTSYYQSMFKTVGSIGNMDFLEPVGGRVTNSMNIELSKDCIASEVYFFRLKQMHLTKAPSSDGMPHIFSKSIRI